MNPDKRPFASIAYDLVSPIHPSSSKGDSYILTHMCLLMNYPIIIPVPNKSAESVIQAYMKEVYTTFGGLLTVITDNGKEFKNQVFQKVEKN